MDRSKSYYVGGLHAYGFVVCDVTLDAAGRPRDHSDSDKKYAENAGVPFYTETQFFKEKHAA